MKYLFNIFLIGLMLLIMSCHQKTEVLKSTMPYESKVSMIESNMPGKSFASLAIKNKNAILERPLVLVTGSTTGLGELAAKALVAKGYRVVAHARNEKRAADVRKSVPGIESVVIGDLSNMEETKKLAIDINKLGTFDAVIMNAGVYYEPSDVIFKVNVLAPYILTSLIKKPKRLIYISSDMHLEGKLKLDELNEKATKVTYPDSKLMLLTMAMAVSRKWPDVYVNTVHPGWVPTRMGGVNAPDDLVQGYQTQVWLAEGIDQETHVSGKYFFHKKYAKFKEIAKDKDTQDKLLEKFAKITGIDFPKQ